MSVASFWEVTKADKRCRLLAPVQFNFAQGEARFELERNVAEGSSLFDERLKFLRTRNGFFGDAVDAGSHNQYGHHQFSLVTFRDQLRSAIDGRNGFACLALLEKRISQRREPGSFIQRRLLLVILGGNFARR